jgi:hypothetical protein
MQLSLDGNLQRIFLQCEKYFFFVKFEICCQPSLGGGAMFDI